MYEHILVPTDGSDASIEALDEAFELAERFEATVHALYVVDDAALASTGLDDMSFDTHVDDFFADMEAVGERATDRIREAAAEEGIDVVTAVVNGTPAHEIVTYANEHDIDLVVMATHGRRGVERVLLGSTTERVVRRANVPVLTVRIGAEKPPRGSTE
ncbi:universal stress protein UspA [Halarchaeum grantii]|uniref:Universal stress protein UspA n=1 Tax=Halarchaeum grantii TaxID=1193105 RepID=A0A830F4S9_9EURY|nr:universal stress protein [Halarchaeum grantii]GGL39202.1 universal stress protein UspA [Halarchaeum grantii]